jgi:hypothetical protein
MAADSPDSPIEAILASAKHWGSATSSGKSSNWPTSIFGGAPSSC